MMRKLNEREKRMVLIGVVAVVAMVVFGYGTKGLDRWNNSRSSAALAKRKLSDVETDKAKLAGLLSLVPVFETPQTEEKQASLFREKLHEQLKKAGINPEPLTLVPSNKKVSVGGVSYRPLKIKCKAKCKLDQVLDFLAGLKENPYFVGVEELQIRCDTKEPPEKRKDKTADVDLVVSTFVKDFAGKPGEAKSSQHADQNSR
jgi:hypothetical protein